MFELLAPDHLIPLGSLRHRREFGHFSDMGTCVLMFVGLQECMRRAEGSWSLVGCELEIILSSVYLHHVHCAAHCACASACVAQ